jgi:hypothetical protein
MNIKWLRDSVNFHFAADGTNHPVCTVKIQTPGGTILVMFEPEEIAGTLYLRGFHIQGEDISMNELGPSRLRNLTTVAIEELGYDGIVIEVAIRTTGAGRGRRPRLVRFTRCRFTPP